MGINTFVFVHKIFFLLLLVETEKKAISIGLLHDIHVHISGVTFSSPINKLMIKKQFVGGGGGQFIRPHSLIYSMSKGTSCRKQAMS